MDIWPEIRDNDIIGIDLETVDPHLFELGPGGFRNDGFVLGCGISTASGFEHYYDIYNKPALKPKFVAWANEQLCGNSIKVGANIQYELTWLSNIDVKMENNIRDVQIAEPLIDEEQEAFNLNFLSNKYLGESKLEDEMEEWANTNNIKNYKGNLHLLPTQLVGAYCIKDARLARLILPLQEEIINNEGMQQIYALELELIPIIHEIQKFGIRVDVDKAQQLSKEYLQNQEIMHSQLKKEVGLDIDIWSVDSLAEVFTKFGHDFPRTKKFTKKNPIGSPSFRGEWLEKHPWEIAQKLAELRKLDRVRTTYIENISKFSYNGRVHTSIHQLAGDEYGTRSGRPASTHPNFYQIPKRGKFAKTLRDLYLPEEGEQWGSFDVSAQEPHIMLHYAQLTNKTKAKEFIQRYRQEGLDFHTFVLTMLKDDTIIRQQAKTISLGRMYVMGVDKLCLGMKVDTKRGKEIFEVYDGELPFIKELQKDCTRRAENVGYIKTIRGRHRHFNKVEPNLRYPDFMDKKRKYMGMNPKDVPEYIEYLKGEQVKLIESEANEEELKYAELAISDWQKPLKRAFCYKALNSLIQGSAADLTKEAMIHIWKKYKDPKLLLAQIYDSFETSIPNKSAGLDLKKEMESLWTDLAVPLTLDFNIGKSWGSVTADD